MAILILKSFTLMSSTSFGVYLISGAQCAKLGQIGRNPRPNWQAIMKQNILQSKGLSHGLTGPLAASTLVFRLKPAPLKNVHTVIKMSVHRRAEKSQDQAGRPLLGRPAPNHFVSSKATITDPQ
jgi:hypothetical protein